ncbi:hypothetical protein CVT25_010465, partial [Psilocybe cyanescens]
SPPPLNSPPPLVSDGDLDSPELNSDVNSYLPPPFPILVEPSTPVCVSPSSSPLPTTPAPVLSLPSSPPPLNSPPPLVSDGDLDSPELNSDVNSYLPPPFPILVEPSTPVCVSPSSSPLPTTPAPVRILPLRSSSREHCPTEKGSFHARLVEASVLHREKLRVSREAREASVASLTGSAVSAVPATGSAVPAVPDRLDDDDNPFASMCCTGAFDNRLPSEFPSSYLTVSLDVEDYLARDSDALWESTLLSVRSDIRRLPSSPGYDMSIPPANYAEAMARSDADEWRKVVVKELEMLRSMGVYMDDLLPDGM